VGVDLCNQVSGPVTGNPSNRITHHLKTSSNLNPTWITISI
jgi:hypothetical protein